MRYLFVFYAEFIIHFQKVNSYMAEYNVNDRYISLRDLKPIKFIFLIQNRKSFVRLHSSIKCRALSSEVKIGIKQLYL